MVSVSAFQPRPWPAACLAILIPAVLSAQAPPGGGGGSARPIMLSPTGRTSPAGVVSVDQSTSPAGVETVSTSVQVGGNLQGSVPGAAPPAGPILLSLEDAIRMGLRNNLGVIAAGNSSAAAGAERLQSLAALLPYVSAGAGDTVAQTNLAAYGFKFNLPPGLELFDSHGGRPV